jgi:hypothetical protein
MPNRPGGEHPVTRVLVHGQNVYGPEIDGLIREIYSLPGGLAALYQQRLHRLIYAAQLETTARPELHRELTALRERLIAGTGRQ